MLAAAQRLRRGNEFAAAIRRGRRAGRGAVVVHLDLADPTAIPADMTRQKTGKPARSAGAQTISAPARAGFVVSRAVGGAVVRNRIRRRLRHLVRERLANLPAGATLVVRALPDAATIPYARLAAELDAAIAAVSAPRRPGRRSR